MRKHITYLALSLYILGLSACAKDNLDAQGGSMGKEGKSVSVQLNLRIPPVTTPQGMLSRSGLGEKEFSVQLSNEVTVPETRAAGTTELYNLWLFQFDASGAIQGVPQKISDQINMVKDQALLPATLRVGANQTLYLVALGPKVTPSSELGAVRSITDLEGIGLNYTENRNGLFYCRITNDSEVPYGGKASGVTIRELDNSGVGEIVYGTPDGFMGGIEIKRLVARVQLKHKLDLTANKLEGLKLLKVPSQLFINPAATTAQDAIAATAKIDLESDNALSDSDKDADGFFTSQWYVAQNKQGTQASIFTEKDRYRKVDDGSGLAPEFGTNIEIWSYSNSNRTLYTVHQIYVGNNNINNFDVEINTDYNLRTIVNSADLGDGRIRSCVAQQSVYLASNSYAITSSDGGRVGPTDYYRVAFDAHYGWRPVIIEAQGRKVSVGIYKTRSCAAGDLIDMNNPSESWLQLSSFPNYTEAIRNGKQTSLVNKIETNIFLPTRFKLYLYADEYIFNEDGSTTDYVFEKSKKYNLVCSGSSSSLSFVKTRTLYVKVVTEDISAEGKPKKIEVVFTLNQNQGYYAGLFGGQIVNGQYTKGLIVDTFDESFARIDDKYPVPESIPTPPAFPKSAISGIQTFGYSTISTKYSWSTSFDIAKNYSYFVSGKQATYNFATNPDNHVVNKGKPSAFPNMRKVNGEIDIYQYDYYATFAARFCYDMNRDKNGDGKITYDAINPELNEYEWYLPSAYQALGMRTAAGTIVYSSIFALATEIDATNSSTSNYESTGWNGVNLNKNDVGREMRCVRDIPVPEAKKRATKATTYTDELNGEKYVMIDISNLPNGTIDRTSDEGKAELNEELDLWSYSSTGQAYDPVNAPLEVDRSVSLNEKVTRARKTHSGDLYSPISPENLITAFSSAKFIVSPTDVYNDGDTKPNTNSDVLKNAIGVAQPNRNTMPWGEANGRLNTANTQEWSLPSQATKTGCYAYGGKNGNDKLGTWRVPSSRELAMILMFAKDLEKDRAETGFEPLYTYPYFPGMSYGYWSATLRRSATEATYGTVDSNYNLTVYSPGRMGSAIHRLRCIRDVK